MSKKQSPLEAIEELYSIQLESDEVAFVFSGYSGILLRTKDTAIAFDPGKSLSPIEISALKHLNFVFYTHNHWDHFNLELAVKIYSETNAHIVTDSVSYAELVDRIPSEKLTFGESRSSAVNYEVAGYNIVALCGIHIGPINQYIVDLGGLRIFHGGDSGYWRHKNQTSDIAFVPTGTATTCAPGVALATVMDLQPKVVVAIHGNRKDMKQFKGMMRAMLPDTELIVPERFKVIRFTGMQTTETAK